MQKWTFQPPLIRVLNRSFLIWKTKKKLTSTDCKHVFQKKFEKNQKIGPSCDRNFYRKKFQKKKWKKVFFNKSVNLSTKFSKKSIFVEKWQKKPLSQQWVRVKKVVFSTIFSVLSVILYQKTVFFWGFFKYPKKLVPAAIGTLDVILSEKKCQDSQHVMSKIHEFWEYQFKFFSCFSKKVEKKMNFFDSSHISKKWRKTQKKGLFFWKITKITFQLTMGRDWKKKLKTNLAVLPL